MLKSENKKKKIFSYIKHNCSQLFGPSFIATKKDLKFDYNQFNDNKIKEILAKFGDCEKLRILYLSSYKPNYTRTETILNLFDRNKINYKAIITGKQKFRYLRLIKNLIKYQRKYDLIFVAFRGHEILPFIKLFAIKPIIFDAYVSIYDTLCLDRKIFKPRSLVGRLLKRYDRFLCDIADVVLLDTQTHANYFIKEFKICPEKVHYLYVGCNEKLFKPIKVKKDPNKFIIFWYGTVHPLQGVDVILKAAKKLEKFPEIIFHLVGPIRSKYQKLINELNLKNVRFTDWVPYEQLPKEIAKADLCLGGHFSTIPKATHVIAGKTFQFINMKKNTIISNNKSNEEIIKCSINKK